MRTYKTVTKKQLAQAYGFHAAISIVRRVEALIHQLDDEALLRLGKWTGNGHLLPAQVEVLVQLLGPPSETNILFIEQRSE